MSVYLYFICIFVAEFMYSGAWIIKFLCKSSNYFV